MFQAALHEDWSWETTSSCPSGFQIATGRLSPTCLVALKAHWGSTSSCPSSGVPGRDMAGTNPAGFDFSAWGHAPLQPREAITETWSKVWICSSGPDWRALGIPSHMHCARGEQVRRRDWCALPLLEVTGPEPTVLGEILIFFEKSSLGHLILCSRSVYGGWEGKVKRKQSISWTLAQVFFKHLLWDLFFIFPCVQTELLCPTAQQTVLQSLVRGEAGRCSCSRCRQGPGQPPRHSSPLGWCREAEDQAQESFISARRERFNTGCPGRLTAFQIYAKKKKKKSLDTEQSSRTGLFASPRNVSVL